MKTILFGIGLIAVGFLVIWKTNWFVQNFGAIGWAEEHLGSGGTWSFYKILGVVLIIAAFVIIL